MQLLLDFDSDSDAGAYCGECDTEPDTLFICPRCKYHSNVVEKKVERVLRVESFVTHMMENEENNEVQ